MPRRRIVYLADTMVQAQMLTCLRRSFDVTLVTPRSLGDAATTFRPGDDPDLGRLECVELPGGRAGFPLRAARWLRRHRRRHDAVVVLDALSAALGANLGRALGGPPVVLQVGRPVVEYIDCAIRQHGPTPGLRLRRRVARWLIAFNEGAAAGVGTVSEYLAKRSANVGATAIHWQGVDLDRFHPGIDQMEARRVLGLPLDRPIVLWRSRLAPEKDLETFLDAVRLLRAVGLDVCPVVMGGEMDEVRARAAAYGVEILGRNASSPDEIPLWYAAADVKVQTSHAEGLGLSVLEALACGRPVVVTDTGGLPELSLIHISEPTRPY